MNNRSGGTEDTGKLLASARSASYLRLFGQIISWASTILVVRFLTPRDYGLNSMLEAPMELMLLFSTIGLDVALVQSRQLTDRALSATFGLLLLIGALSTSTYFFGAPFIASYFSEPSLENLARVLSPIFLLIPFRVIPDALLDRQLKFKLRANVEFWSSIVGTVVTFSLALAGFGVWALVTGLLANRVVNTILLMVLQPWFIRPSFDFGAARALFVFGGLSTLASIIQLVAGKSVTLIAGPVLGASALGVFAMAVQFALLPLTRVMPILNPVLVPAFARLGSDREAASNYLAKALKTLTILLIPLLFGLASLAEPFVRIVLSERWEAATLPLMIISATIPMKIVSSLFRPVLISLGRVDLVLALSCIGLLLSSAGAYLARNHGVMGLVLMSVVLEAAMTMATLYFTRRAIEFRFRSAARAYAPAVVAGTIMVATLFLFRSSLEGLGNVTWLLAGTAIGAVVYLLVLMTLFRDAFQSVRQVVLGR